MENKEFFTNFINQAERAFLRVANRRPSKEKFIEINGVNLRSTPQEFNQPIKIFRFFRQFWSPCFANRMMCNLKVTLFNDRTFVLLGDATAPNEVISLRILKSTDTFTLLEARLDPGNVKVRYVLRKNNQSGKFTIVKRTNLDFRYTACNCIIPPIRFKA